jgi:hypothetical protein
MSRRFALALACALMTMLGAPAARASVGQESMFQDDKLLVYGTPATVGSTLDTLRGLGVDRVRVSVFWNLVAPDATSRTRPTFDATDPGAYPPGSWDRYDTLLRLAQQRGIGVNFDLTSPAPYWATGLPPRLDIEKNYLPSADEFGRFATAIGKRYGGAYTPPGAPAPLPRVDYWSVWNEPNQPGWLTPQWTGSATHPVEAAPRLYRDLVDAAFGGLKASGHAGDTILIGETAPKGLNVTGLTRAIKALHFIRQLYCLDDSYRPLAGAAATARGCPAKFDAQAFVNAHPALFEATGWAHHPYELTFAPSQPPTDPDYVTIANLPSLSAALATILKVYGQTRPAGMPLYLTEFGYLTQPPSPLGVSFARQQAYLDQSEFITYNDPQVRTLTQFLLTDDLPKSGVSDPVAAFGGTFQTGLELASGARKPSFYTYRLPVFLPETTVRRRHTARVWGFVRAAPRGTVATVAVQFKRRSGRGAFRTLRSLRTGGTTRYLDVRLRLPGTGLLRLAWAPPGGGAVVYSRVVGVRVR